MDVGIAISIAVGVATLVALVGSIFYWAGKMSNRVDALGIVIQAQGARIDGRIDALTERIDTLGERIEGLAAVVQAQGERIDALGQRLDRRIDALGERIDGRVDALAAEMAATRRELVAAISYHDHDVDGSVRFRVPPAE